MPPLDGALTLGVAVTLPYWTLVQSIAVLTDRSTDRLDQEAIVEWLAEVPGGSGCVDALPHGDLVIGGDEDDRDDDTIDLQLRLKLETSHAAVQVDVQNEAGGEDQRG